MSYRHYAVICSDSRYFLVLWLFFLKWALESAVQTEKTLFFFLSTAREIKGDVGGLKVKEPSVRRTGLSLWYSSSCGFWSCAISISKQQGKKRPFFSPPRRAALSSLDLEPLPGILQSLLKVTAGRNTTPGLCCRNNNKRALKLFKANLGPAGQHFLILFQRNTQVFSAPDS